MKSLENTVVNSSLINVKGLISYIVNS